MSKFSILTLILFSIFSSCTEEEKISTTVDKEVKTKTISQPDTLKEVSKTSVKPKTLLKDNVLEIYHTFSSEQLIGDSIRTNLENSTGAMLSAYSLDKGEYDLFFRVRSGNTWSKWKQLHLNHHVNNPERKVYDATNITNDIDLLQFKSNSATKSEVVFRLYKFLNE